MGAVQPVNGWNGKRQVTESSTLDVAPFAVMRCS